MDEAIRAALALQGRVCGAFGSPFSAGVLKGAAQAAGRTPALDRLLAPWEGRTTQALMAAAVPLRLLGALHDLALSGEAPELTATYPAPGREGDGAAAWRAAAALMEAREPTLAAFMAHEPQTNEPGRAAVLLGGFLAIAEESGAPLRCCELGASAGLNLSWDAFGYRLGEAGTWGETAAGLVLKPEWRGGPPPLAAPARVAGRAACDRSPIALADPLARRRLTAFVWPDQQRRLANLEAAMAIALKRGVTVERAEAAAFVSERAAPRAGFATVVYHSIVWSYLEAQAQAALMAAIARQGERASARAPFYWLRMEPGAGAPLPIALTLTAWPGGAERLLARAHPHGAWVEWLG